MRTIYSKHARPLTYLMLAAMAALLASCGGSGVTTTTTTTTSTAATLSLATTATSVKSDGSTTTTLTATVLDSNNSVVSGQPVSFSASTGQLSIASTTSDANGQVTAIFSGGPSGINRTATIIATSGGASSQLPIQITGSTISVTTSGNSVSDDGVSTVTATFTAMDASNSPVSGAAVTLAKSGVGNISFTPTSGTTDANGKLVVTVTGITGGAGLATLTATALGATGSTDITVSTAATTFNISGLTLNATALTSANTNSFTATSMKTSDSLLVTVTAPAATNVTFVSTMGVWNGGTNVATVAVAGGVASATLTTAAAGIANIQVLDPLVSASSDTLTVSMTATTANAITLQASPSVIPKSSGGNTGTSTLIATVTDANNLPVGDAPVAFSIINSTGGGESVSPVVAYTASTATANLSLGQALTTFTAGSLSSGANGVQIRAKVLGTAVATEVAGANVTASGNDAAIVIGGSAGSVAFGQATVLTVNSNATQYILAMSVMVADSNGNPAPEGTVVNLSLWPIAWSTGVACSEDPDGFVWNGTAYVAGNGGTFLNEDVNENLVLDGTEDGTRKYYATGLAAPGTGTKDTHITPSNSVAGTVPSSITTDASGVATFNLTYPKTSAIWTVVRLRGRTVVQGSDAVGEVQFRLGGLESDIATCRLPDSTHIF